MGTLIVRTSQPRDAMSQWLRSKVRLAGSYKLLLESVKPQYNARSYVELVFDRYGVCRIWYGGHARALIFFYNNTEQEYISSLTNDQANYTS